MIDEWRELERQLAAADVSDSDHAALIRRIAELRAEYHVLARRRGSYEDLLHPLSGSRDDASDVLTTRRSAGSPG